MPASRVRCSRCGCKSCICGTDKDLMGQAVFTGETKDSMSEKLNQIKDRLSEEIVQFRNKDVSEATSKDFERLEELSKIKDTNPKDAVGIKKGPISTVSGPVMAELGVAMLEGARKYGRHNYRISGVRASVYRDATWRHIAKWWAGQDIDPDSGLSHITKALASLMVLRDAMLFDKMVDDRPPALPNSHKFWADIDKMVVDLIEKHPNAKEPFTNEGIQRP